MELFGKARLCVKKLIDSKTYENEYRELIEDFYEELANFASSIMSKDKDLEKWKKVWLTRINKMEKDEYEEWFKETYGFDADDIDEKRKMVDEWMSESAKNDKERNDFIIDSESEYVEEEYMEMFLFKL